MGKNKTAKSLAPDALGIGALISYGIGDFGMVIGWSFVSGFITFYMTGYVHIAAGVVGTVIMLARVLDALSDVTVGMFVDRTKTRFGKARPWMLCCVVPLVVTFILLFSVPDLSYSGSLIWFIIFYVLAVCVFYTAVNVPYGSLVALMTRDSSSRVKCGVVRMTMGIFSGVIISSLTMPVINALGDNRRAWSVWIFIVGIFMGICILLCFAFVRERYSEDLSLGASGSGLPSTGAKRTLAQSYKTLITNKYWVILTIVILFCYALQGVATGVNIFYFKYIIGDENLLGLSAVAMALPLMITLCLTPLLSKKFSKGTLARISAIGGIAAPLALLLGTESLTFMLLRSVMMGIFMAPITGVAFAMIADVSDYGYWKTGVKCEGLVSSAVGFGTKVGSGVGAGMIGWFLALGGYDAQLPVQPDSAISMMKFMAIGMPIILSLLSFAVLLFYKLDNDHAVMLAEIKERESEAE